MGKKSSRHSDLQLIYALNEEEQIVGINDVPNGANCKCFCPACKEPLVAKNEGVYRTHHFAHQSGTECGYAVESMLHILAKEKVRNAFLSNNNFFVKFEYKSCCPNYDSCIFILDEECYYHSILKIPEYKRIHASNKFLDLNKDKDCYERKIVQFDLKQFYDSCEQERSYDTINRRSDLKIFLSTNPKREPIYIEFCVTHASDAEKLHSGNKIIEIKIETEDDINCLIENGITESKCELSNEDTLDNNKIQFYGFKNQDRSKYNLSKDVSFDRCIFRKSGEILFSRSFCNCKEITRLESDSLLEICIPNPNAIFENTRNEIYEKIKYLCYDKYRILNCSFCMNCDESNFYKRCKLDQLNNEYLDTTYAKKCSYFKVDQQKMDAALSLPIDEHWKIID